MENVVFALEAASIEARHLGSHLVNIMITSTLNSSFHFLFQYPNITPRLSQYTP